MPAWFSTYSSSWLRYAGLMFTRIGADLRGRVLDEDPLGAVRRPDADPVALGDADLQERRRDPVDRIVELLVTPPASGRDVDERVVFW